MLQILAKGHMQYVRFDIGGLLLCSLTNSVPFTRPAVT